jgi:hypothetical protein
MDPINLSHPITSDGRQITEVNLRRPKVADVVAARKNKADEAEQETALMANLSGLPPSAILDLDIADYKKLQERLADFFG